MSFSDKLITVSGGGSFGPGENFEISLVLEDDAYSLQGKSERVDERARKLEETCKTVKVSKEWADGILNELRSARIPLLPQEVHGCDGDFYTMTVGSCFGGATYSWWSEPPTGWEVLPKVTRQIIDKFSKALPK